MKSTLLRYVPVLLFLLFLFWVIVATDTNSLPSFIRHIYRFPHGDWVGHFVLYSILALLAVRAFPRRVNCGRVKFPLSALFVALLVTIEELSQFCFPNRTPDLTNLSFGILGTIVGTLLGIMKR